MKNWYRSLNIYYRVVLWANVIGMIVFCLSTPLFFFGYSDLPLGLLLGTIFSSIFYLLIGVCEKHEIETHRVSLSIFLSFLRLFCIIGLAFLLGYLYFTLEIKIFNVFAFIGGYFISLVTFSVLTLKGRGKEDDANLSSQRSD